MDRQRLLENHTVEELADTVLKLRGKVKELNNENYLLNSKIKDLINGEREIMYLVDEQSADIKEYNILGKIGEGTYFANGTGVKIDDLRSFLKYKSEHKEHDSKFTDEIRELKNEIEELKKRNDELNEWCQKYKWRAEEYRVAILPRATEKAKKAIDEREFLSIRIEEIEEIKAKNEKIKELCDENMQLQLKRNELRQTVDDLQEKISELESELSVKENLLKIKNGLCGENDLSGLTPIEVAEKLINAESEYETNSIKRAFGAGEKEKYNIFSVSELRQIAEHLLVYCNANEEVEE